MADDAGRIYIIQPDPVAEPETRSGAMSNDV
jgi:hypothetical protein